MNPSGKASGHILLPVVARCCFESITVPLSIARTCADYNAISIASVKALSVIFYWPSKQTCLELSNIWRVHKKINI